MGGQREFPRMSVFDAIKSGRARHVGKEIGALGRRRPWAARCPALSAPPKPGSVAIQFRGRARLRAGRPHRSRNTRKARRSRTKGDRRGFIGVSPTSRRAPARPAARRRHDNPPPCPRRCRRPCGCSWMPPTPCPAVQISRQSLASVSTRLERSGCFGGSFRRVDAPSVEAGLEEVAADAGQAVGVDEIAHLRPQQHLLVGLGGAGFFAGHEAGADIGEVRAERFGGANLQAIVDRAAKDQATVAERADFARQREAALQRGVAAGARADADQPVDAGGRRLRACAALVTSHNTTPAIGLHGFDNRAGMAERRQNERARDV